MKIVEIKDKNFEGIVSKTRIACRAIIMDGDNILTSFESLSGIYMIPGGGLEENETYIECCIREVSEETGYIVQILDNPLEIDEYYQTRKFVNFYFVCKIEGKGKRKLTEREIEVGMEARWVNKDILIKEFETYEKYRATDEMRCGLYYRELMALKNIKL